MHKLLIAAIEDVINSHSNYYEENIDKLKKVYESLPHPGDTDTMHRVDFLREKLDEGMSKRDAAKALCKYDPRVGPKTAETIVYTVFSGMYQKSRRGRKGKTTKARPLNVPPQNYTSSPANDEDII